MAERTPNCRTSYDAEQTTPRLPAAPPTIRRRARPAPSGSTRRATAAKNASASTRRMRRGRGAVDGRGGGDVMLDSERTLAASIACERCPSQPTALPSRTPRGEEVECRVRRDTHDTAAISGHGIDLEVPVAVRVERDAFTVARPHRIVV